MQRFGHLREEVPEILGGGSIKSLPRWTPPAHRLDHPPTCTVKAKHATTLSLEVVNRSSQPFRMASSKRPIRLMLSLVNAASDLLLEVVA